MSVKYGRKKQKTSWMYLPEKKNLNNLQFHEMNSEGKYVPVVLIQLYFLDITKPLFCLFSQYPQTTTNYRVN